MDEESVSATTHTRRMKRLTHDYVEGGQSSLFLFSPENNAFCRVVPNDQHAKDEGTENRSGVIQCGSNKLPLTAAQQVERMEKMLTYNPLKFGDKYSFHITNRYNDQKNITKNGDRLKNISHGMYGRTHQLCSLKALHTDSRIIPQHAIKCNMPESCINKSGAFHLQTRRPGNEYTLHVTGDLGKSKECFIEKNGEVACNRHKKGPAPQIDRDAQRQPVSTLQRGQIN